MQASNAVKLCSVNQIEFPLKGRPLESYRDITEEKLIRVILAVHSIKSACRQEAYEYDPS
jgi:hypothetical protein